MAAILPVVPEGVQSASLCVDCADNGGNTAHTVRIQCPRCGLTKDWPEDRAMPLCGECRFGWRRQAALMLRIPGEKARPVKGAPDLPEGLLPFEATVMRTMRRATVRAADHERARTVAWLRQQKADWWPDFRDLAEAIRQGEHHLSRRSSNTYVMAAKKGGKRQN